MKILRFPALLLAATIFMTSCSDDDDNPPTPNNPAYEVPDTYVFTDEAGNNTVSNQGQADRLNQLTAMVDYMKLARTPGTALDAQVLKDMYANTGGNGGGHFDFTSEKQLRDKTAVTFADAETVRESMEEWMDELAAASQTTVAGEYTGSNGQAGLVKSGDSGPYLQNANGMEHLEIIEKGLMSAVFYNQITGWYLSDDLIGDQVNNTDPVDPENGKYYTEMEHHWDEAYGYFTSSPNFPTEGADRFWSKYSDRVNEALGTNDKIMNAYLTGRAAISNDDMTTKITMRDEIITQLERVAAGKAVGYLNLAAANFDNNALRNHTLSEAFGFIDGLRYNPHSTLSTLEINALLDQLGDNFYEVTLADINAVKGQLASAMGFTPEQVLAL